MPKRPDEKPSPDEFEEESFSGEDKPGPYRDASVPGPGRGPDEPPDKINPFEDPDYVFEEEQVREATGWRDGLKAFGLFSLLLLFHGLQLASWNRRETRPPSWDQSIQLEIAADYARAFREGRYGELFTLAPKPGMPPFPPLYHLAIQYAMDEADPAAAARWANFFFLSLLAVSVFGLAHQLGGVWAGLAAALLFTCMPEVQWLYRDQLVDLALTAWVAAAYWALLLSEKFERKRPTIVFGVCFGLAMLTKWSAFSYFLPVYWWGMEATNERHRFRNFTKAFGAAFALAAPWYLVQWSTLVPRLFAAASDNAVSFTTASGLFAYIQQMSAGMETPFFLVGLISLTQACATKKARGDAELLLTWFFSSFVFWTLVPNRQLRYLLPGLPALAVLAGATGGRKLLLALCAFQLFAAANYSFGWIAPKRAELGLSVSFFRGDVPAREDWKLAEILRFADERRDKSLPFANLTLLANHKRFNGPAFNWEAKRLALDGIRIRGVNRRVCEFSEFLLMKMGSLGPPEVVNQLPKVRDELLIDTSWFLRGYALVRSFPLPDGSEAALYQRRRPPAPPVPGAGGRFDYLEEEKLTAEGLDIALGEYDASRGAHRTLGLRAKSLVIRGLRLSGVDLEMEDAAFVPVKDPEATAPSKLDGLLLDVRLLSMKRLRLRSVSLAEADAAAFIERRVKGARAVKVRLDKTIQAEAEIRGARVFAELSLAMSPGKDALEVRLERLKLGGVPIPVRLLGTNAGYRLGFEPDPELPFELDIPGVTISGGVLSVSENTRKSPSS